MAPTFDPPSSLTGIDTLVGEVEDVTLETLLVAIEDRVVTIVDCIGDILELVGDILEFVGDILEFVAAIVVTDSVSDTVSDTAEDVGCIVKEVTVDEDATDVEIVVVF